MTLRATKIPTDELKEMATSKPISESLYDITLPSVESNAQIQPCQAILQDVGILEGTLNLGTRILYY